jgi:hypothetical protein
VPFSSAAICHVDLPAGSARIGPQLFSASHGSGMMCRRQMFRTVATKSLSAGFSCCQGGPGADRDHFPLMLCNGGEDMEG